MQNVVAGGGTITSPRTIGDAEAGALILHLWGLLELGSGLAIKHNVLTQDLPLFRASFFDPFCPRGGHPNRLGLPAPRIRLGRMFCHFDPHTTDMGELKAVHVERANGCSTDRRRAHDFRAIFTPGAMIRPGLLMRVKQRDLILRHWVWGSLALRLETIARWTSEAEIAKDRVAVGGTGNDVLNLKRRGRHGFRGLTVGATMGECRWVEGGTECKMS